MTENKEEKYIKPSNKKTIFLQKSFDRESSEKRREQLRKAFIQDKKDKDDKNKK